MSHIGVLSCKDAQFVCEIGPHGVLQVLVMVLVRVLFVCLRFCGAG